MIEDHMSKMKIVDVSPMPPPDITGWAVKYGMIGGPGYEIPIVEGAFARQNEVKVPLIWNHYYSIPSYILGDGILYHYPKEGIYFKGWFSNPERTIVQDTIQAIRNGYVRTLSIFANKLQFEKKIVRNGTTNKITLKAISDGMIKEVSLVLWAPQPNIYREPLIETLFGEKLEWAPDNTGIFQVDVIQNPETGDLMCDYCGTGLKVDENGNWPDFCPGCHMELDYKDGVL